MRVLRHDAPAFAPSHDRFAPVARRANDIDINATTRYADDAGSDDDARWMRRAIELAERAVGLTSPNPPVGAVLVADNRIVGEGWHRGLGQPHAEAEAIADAGDAARGATAYVTLEPCNHTGRTPPCAEGLLHAGIARVVYAVTDPNPIASGGAARLREAGLDVIGGVEERAARHLARFFLHYIDTHRPWVIAKSASSLDGRVATRTGDTRWITGDDARRAGHRLRQATDAILIGIETAIADDPALTVRLPEGDCAADDVRHPLPIVLDSRARLPLDARVLSGPRSPMICVGHDADPARRDALRARGADVYELADAGQGLSAAALLDELGTRGVQSLLLEGGPSVHGSFADAGLIDEVVLFLAPMLIGGHEAPAAFGGDGAAVLADALRLDNPQVEPVGDDLMIGATVRRASDGVLAPRFDAASIHKERAA